MSHVFLSYVREDSKTIEGIRGFLENMDISVWMDRSSILGGEHWRQSIQRGIEEAAFFVACFSESYATRDATYMDEELSIALKVLQHKSRDESWFIPLRLDNCLIPNRHLTFGRGDDAFSDLQFIDLFLDEYTGFVKLAEVVLPKLNPIGAAKGWFEPAVEQHIEKKIVHYTNLGGHLTSDIKAKWRSLLDKQRLAYILTEFGQLYRRAVDTGDHQLGHLLESSANGTATLLSVVPHRNIADFLQSLSPPRRIVGHNYLDFILDKRAQFRLLPNWEYRDFVHIICFNEPNALTVDMLYIEDEVLRIGLVEESLKHRKRASNAGDKHGFFLAFMYPTSVISASEAGILWDKVIADDVEFGESS